MIKNITRNLSLFFSLIGIAITIYWTLFLIPRQFDDQRSEKIQNINRELIENVQALLHTDHPMDPQMLESMIKSKELKEGIHYPYSIDELLIQTQEAVISNEFISSEKRQIMTQNLVLLQRETEEDPRYANRKTRRGKNSQKTNLFNPVYWQDVSLIEWLAGFGGIIISILGIYSLYYKIAIERRKDLEDIINNEKDRIEDAIRTSMIFDDLIVQALDELDIDHQVIFNKFSRADVMVKTDSGKSIFIKTRYFRQRKDIPTDFYENLINLAKSNKANAIYLANLNDKEGSKAFENFNKASKENKIYMIVAETKEEMKAMLVNTVHRIEESA